MPRKYGKSKTRKLTDDEVKVARDLYDRRQNLLAEADLYTVSKLAEKMDISYVAMYEIVNRHTYIDVH